jgi:hypothetical protein
MMYYVFNPWVPLTTQGCFYGTLRTAPYRTQYSYCFVSFARSRSLPPGAGMLKIWFIKYSELLYKYCSYQRGKCEKHREAINSFLKFILSLPRRSDGEGDCPIETPRLSETIELILTPWPELNCSFFSHQFPPLQTTQNTPLSINFSSPLSVEPRNNIQSIRHGYRQGFTAELLRALTKSTSWRAEVAPKV